MPIGKEKMNYPDLVRQLVWNTIEKDMKGKLLMVILFISLFCSSCGQRLELEAEYHPKGYSYYVKRQSYRFPERTVFDIITDDGVAARIDWTNIS